MSETKITVIKNGPLLVQGNVNITGENGQSIPVNGPKCALCRCGASENKPFCDGSHKGHFEHEAIAFELPPKKV